jgi:predicted PurR-regulated permease PerM
MMPSARSVVRIVLIVVCVAIVLYLLWLLRRPISWLLIAVFLTVALSAPVNWLSQKMRRGLAITIVYLGLLLVPIALIALIVPPLITEGTRFAKNVPDYAQDVTDYVHRNKRLREINQDYDITGQIEKEAAKLPGKLGGAAGTLRDVGFGIVNSLFALLTILVLTAFLLSNGRRWTDAAIAMRPPEQRERLRRALDHMGAAVGGYVAGALAIALIAGVLTYIVLLILGVPFRGPLAVIAGLFSLIPLVGATIAAVLIGVVTLFEDFPTATIIWVVWAIVYQQFENHVIQPQIQKRTVHVHPFITIVAVLFGATLLGVLGALVAIPVAASIQILIREYVDLRTLTIKPNAEPPAGGAPPAGGGPLPGGPPPTPGGEPDSGGPPPTPGGEPGPGGRPPEPPPAPPEPAPA